MTGRSRRQLLTVEQIPHTPCLGPPVHDCTDPYHPAQTDVYTLPSGGRMTVRIDLYHDAARLKVTVAELPPDPTESDGHGA